MMKRSMRLLFRLIIQPRVTAAPVIEPVMMIWFHQNGGIKRLTCLKVVSQWSSLRLGLAVVGFLTKPARGLSRLPTLDTERM